MKRITVNDGARFDIALWGSDWFGYAYYRVYASPTTWMTFRGLRIMWFTFSIKLPAVVSNLLGDDKEREPW